MSISAVFSGAAGVLSACASCALAFLLAGCTVSPQPNRAHTPDWEVRDPVPTTPPPFAVTNHGSPALAVTSGIPPAAPNGRSAGPAAATADQWLSLQRWSRERGLGVLNRLTDASSASYSLRSTQGTLVFRVGGPTALWDGVELRLGFAPLMIDQQPFVHSLDLSKTIQPLLEQRTALASGGVVVIDPGHGGWDSGAASVRGGAAEKYYTLDWAIRLRNLLTGRGFRVLLTRSTDIEMPLADRVEFAIENRAALFISLHFNSAAPNRTESGLETYCLTPRGLPSTLTRGFADEPGQVFPNNAFDAENLLWSMQIHRSLLQATSLQDRGVRRARFPAVLRGQPCPAVLIEGGYLSNPAEARLIADPAYRQKLAEAVLTAIENPATDR